LLADRKVKNALLITGDRHIGEISRTNVPGLKYPLYEFTASGLTHATLNSKSVNKYRVGALVSQLHYGVFRFTTSGRKLEVEAILKGEGGKVLTSEKITLN
jgi:alkaline phosphatase D